MGFYRLSLSLLVLASLLSGCSSSTKEGQIFWPESDAESQADGAAFTGAGMLFNKPMPSRPNWKPLDFYFKHCSDMGTATFYSKSSYECTYPY